MNYTEKQVITDGIHTSEVISVLAPEIPDTHSIEERAKQIIQNSVDPLGGPPEQPSDGLLYGLIQSGKTSIITVAAAMAADNGFQCILVLTTDIDPLYVQTLDRIRKSLRGMTILGKNDWKDAARFERHLRTPPVVIVCSKNSSKLHSLLDAFRKAGVKGLSALIIDDEADQASLNTNTSKSNGDVSRINDAISSLREFFIVNTYLQVTATPQSLFLQNPNHKYRPSFTVLSEPGPGYVGGGAFFGEDSKLLRIVDINELDHLTAGNQPMPNGIIPDGLRMSLLAFLVGATSKILTENPSGSYAYLCHVSLRTADHNYIVSLMDRFKEQTIRALRDDTNSSSAKKDKLLAELRAAYDDISSTEEGIAEFDSIVAKIKFLLPGASIKLINAQSDEEVNLESAFNIFVGGNKLGRGVTIKNLIVSYYGRNPKRPMSDTVLQHARMYGYRKKDLGVTRLYLPERLAENFRIIHQMESALRDLIIKYPDGGFEGIYISSPLQATRRNVLDPASIGVYVAGRNYSLNYPRRDLSVLQNTDWLDEKLAQYAESNNHYEVAVDFVIKLLERCIQDDRYASFIWDINNLRGALEEIKTLYGDRAYLVVRRNRNLQKPRFGAHGILVNKEGSLAPRDAPTLFMYRMNKTSVGENEVWWPEIRFPDGNYAMAFSFDR